MIFYDYDSKWYPWIDRDWLFPTFVWQLRKKPQRGKLAWPGIEPWPARWEAMVLQPTTAVVATGEKYKNVMGWKPNSMKKTSSSSLQTWNRASLSGKTQHFTFWQLYVVQTIKYSDGLNTSGKSCFFRYVGLSCR